MQRIKYHIKNSRVWHLCSVELDNNAKITLDNWTRYVHEYREVFYLNESVKFLEVDHFHHEFIFFDSSVRQSNIDDFRNYYKLFMQYKELPLKKGYND